MEPFKFTPPRDIMEEHTERLTEIFGNMEITTMADVVEKIDNFYSLYRETSEKIAVLQTEVNLKVEKANRFMLYWTAITAVLTLVSTVTAVVAFTIAVVK